MRHTVSMTHTVTQSQLWISYTIMGPLKVSTNFVHGAGCQEFVIPGCY